MCLHRPLCTLLLLLVINAAVSLQSGAQARNVSFQARRDYSAIGHAGGAAVGDFRGDGLKDVIVTSSSANSGSLAMLRNNGDGSFAQPVFFSTGGKAPFGVAVADINNDGTPDVVVANDLSNNVAVLLGNSNGTLRSPRVIAVGLSPVAVAVGDFNADGKPDVVVANSGSNTISILLGNGDGTLRIGGIVHVGVSPLSVAVGRFHGSTAMDIAVANAGNPDQRDGSVSLVKGNGDGTFQDATNIITGGSPISLATAELNGDLLSDLAVVDASQSAVLIELGSGNGTFRSFGTIQTPAQPVAVTVGDFHGNGRQGDLAVISGSSTELVTVFLNSGNGRFTSGLVPSFAISQNPAAFVTADFNRDGKTDVVAATQLGDISVLLGTGFGRFVSAKSFATGKGSNYVVAHDLNDDGKLDVAVVNELSNTVSILLGEGNGSFAPKNDIPVGHQPFSVTVGDLNGDQKPDLVVANNGHFSDDPGNISILLGNGDGTFQPAKNITVGNIPAFTAIADFNNDGKQDLAVTNFVDNTVSILLGNGDGSFGAPTTLSFPAFSQVLQVFAADVDGDHNQDLVVGGGSNVWIVKGNGFGSFGQPQQVHSGFTGEVAVSDFNGDHTPDLAIIGLAADDATFEVDVLLGNGNGTFRKTASVPFFGSFATEVIAADFNGDGKMGLAMTGLNTLSVAVLTGNGDGTFASTTAPDFGVTTFAQSIAAGDFNGDGKQDIVATGVAADAGIGTSASALSLLLNNTP